MSHTILQRIAQRDQSAVAECLDAYGGLVWSLAERYLKPFGDDVEDAVQDIFVEIWRHAGRYDPAVASEATFIATITHRRLIDRRRRHGGRVALPLERPSDVPNHASLGHDRASVHDELDLARAAFAKLDRDEQQVLWYSLYHGIPHDRIADLIEVPLGTVKTRIRRGLARLRGFIAGTRESEVTR